MQSRYPLSIGTSRGQGACAQHGVAQGMSPESYLRRSVTTVAGLQPDRVKSSTARSFSEPSGRVPGRMHEMSHYMCDNTNTRLVRHRIWAKG